MMRIDSVVLLKNEAMQKIWVYVKKTLAIRGRVIQVQLQKSELH
jgi:methyl coenzyme M reductase beta subunit